jgi:hypothetical protein
LYFFGVDDALWEYSIDCLLYSGSLDGPKFHPISLTAIEIPNLPLQNYPKLSLKLRVFQLLSHW